jgi:uncharacterized protein YajQ (UPF0234 family)
MAADNSFDVTSKVDVQEVRNAMDQAIKEVRTRFDLKDSHSEIKLLEGDETIELASSDQYKLKAVTEILQQKFVKRGVSLKSLDYGKIQRAAEDNPPAGDPRREGQRDCQADQGVQEKGPGIHSG